MSPHWCLGGLGTIGLPAPSGGVEKLQELSHNVGIPLLEPAGPLMGVDLAGPIGGGYSH